MMEHNRIEICADEYSILFFSEKKKKSKVKTYNSYQEWLYHRAPICNEILIVPKNEKEFFIKKTIVKWENELKEYFSKRNKKDMSILDIQIKFRIVKDEECKNFPLKKCLEIMTPEQFFSDFGKFTIDIANKI